MSGRYPSDGGGLRSQPLCVPYAPCAGRCPRHPCRDPWLIATARGWPATARARVGAGGCTWRLACARCCWLTWRRRASAKAAAARSARLQPGRLHSSACLSRQLGTRAEEREILRPLRSRSLSLVGAEQHWLTRHRWLTPPKQRAARPLSPARQKEPVARPQGSPRVCTAPWECAAASSSLVARRGDGLRVPAPCRSRAAAPVCKTWSLRMRALLYVLVRSRVYIMKP